LTISGAALAQAEIGVQGFSRKVGNGASPTMTRASDRQVRLGLSQGEDVAFAATRMRGSAVAGCDSGHLRSAVLSNELIH
jgi:hypothetical protein